MAHGDMYKTDVGWVGLIVNPVVLFPLFIILLGWLTINDVASMREKVKQCEVEHKAPCKIEREVALPKKPSG